MAPPPGAVTAAPDDEQRVAALPDKLAPRPRKPSKQERNAILAQWQAARLNPDGKARSDQPQSAQTYFLEMRLPSDQAVLSPQMYLSALSQAARMPVYSTAQERVIKAATSRPLTAPSIVTQSLDPMAGTLGDWESLGPGNIGGRTRALVIHPKQPDTMWAAAAAGGIWKTTNGGQTWTPKADLLINLAVNSMALEPYNPDILYAGTGEGFFNADAVRGAGILKSTDGGESWFQLEATKDKEDFWFVNKIVIGGDKRNPRIYAATGTGVFRSVDSGTTWVRVLQAGANSRGCMDLAIQNRSVSYVFAACGSGPRYSDEPLVDPRDGVWRAIDSNPLADKNWELVIPAVRVGVPTMGRTSLAIAPSKQNVIYAMAARIDADLTLNDGLLAVYRSDKSGATSSWVPMVNSDQTLNRLLLSNPSYGAGCYGNGTPQFFNQGYFDNVIAVDPTNENVVWAGGIDLFRSDDGGKNWGQASHWDLSDKPSRTDYAHADHHALVFHPKYNGTDNQILFNGNDGGLYKTDKAKSGVVKASPIPITSVSPVCNFAEVDPYPDTIKWVHLNNGYRVTQFYHGLPYPNGLTFFGGTQDNGNIRGQLDSPNNWNVIYSGDGGYVAINPSDTNMLWYEYTNLNIVRSVDGASTTEKFTAGITEPSENFGFIAPFAQDPTNPNRMWIGGSKPWRADNATVKPLPDNIDIWTQAGTEFNTKAATAPTEDPNPKTTTTAIGISPQDSNRVYFGTAMGYIYTTDQGGTATKDTVWLRSKLRSDDNVISSITPDPLLKGTVYATVSTFNSTTGRGHVFKSVDSGLNWTNIDGSGPTAIPDVPVHSIVVDPNPKDQNTRRLYVGSDIGVFSSTDGGLTWAVENTGFANVIVQSLTIAKADNDKRYLYAFTHGRSAYRVALTD
ncbi:hypothetical protein THSYN_28725 [Candidatus Thiodictyon syntrophicum]|jgi:hypothetical protein|uniref:Sortilin N-terminal domain-containing protein n=2 Tax=Candidatus Thiodictyon syntrophicum TaxID=1166950 RepID=A0A2K8UG70_9GAMM|nr:hypothetical protein THSYN_28725 [Candidatus Thiodictyon syntrophicum]